MVTFTSADDRRQSYSGRNPASGYSPRPKRRKPNRFVQGVKDFSRDVGQMGSSIGIPGIAGAAMTGAKNVMRNQVMHGQNRDYFGGNLLHDKIPNKVRESLMTPRDELFYDKYMKLASLGGDREQEYLDTANTAMRNAQITGRLNYGLGQIDPEGEYLNREGLPSYSNDLFGEGYNRFNMDRFKEAMGMGEGILGGLSPLDVHPEILDNYVQKTFQGMAPPDDIIQTDPSADIIETSNLPIDPMPTPNYGDPDYFDWAYRYGDDYLPSGKHKDGEITRTIPGRPITPLQEEVVTPEEPLPFNDNLREAGIMSQYGQGPKYANNSMNYLDEYRNALASGEFGYDTPGGMMDYDEFVENYERLHSLPRGLHLGE